MLIYKNVNEAFIDLVMTLVENSRSDITYAESRNGPVTRFKYPMVLLYQEPTQRVLFNELRDCNPFFHVMEALWMLGGRNDVDYVAFYNPKMRDYSDDGKTLHGAYGYRWRKYFGYDQLDWIAEELATNPTSRRCVLQMWDGGRTKITVDEGWNCGDCGNWSAPEETAESIELTGDLYVATHGGKDVPCNHAATFEVVDGKLNMSVHNRSNDLIWGTLGANYVHFSFLQEYMAAVIGVDVGFYAQITTNLHTYLNVFKGEYWLQAERSNLYQELMITPTPLVANAKLFDQELGWFLADTSDERITEPFLKEVARPMHLAFCAHKGRNYETALDYVAEIISPDWRIASRNWIKARKLSWEEKNRESV